MYHRKTNHNSSYNDSIDYCRYPAFVLLLSLSFTATADEYHYNSIMIGDRAAGLAGAYVAVSDDPSGLYYNPAGIVHATTNNISGSMNAIHTSETVYKNTIGNNSDWVRSSNELLPNFFGVLQDFNNGKAGFSYAVVDATLENQDQDFNNVSSASGNIDNYAINFNNQDKTIYFGPSYASAINKKLSLGFTLYGHYRQKEQILHEYLDITTDSFAETTSYKSIDEFGVRLIFGLMYSPMDRISIGLTVAQTSIISATNRNQNTITQVTNLSVTNAQRTDVENNNKRKLPFTVSAGLAAFVNNALLVTADLTYQEATLDRISVVNFAMGTEYYVSSKWAVRGGIFSNLANTPELKTSNLALNSTQAEKIDYYGFALSVSRFSANNTLSIGIDWSRGNGDAQLFPTGSSGTPRIQSVTSTIMTMFLSATYSY